MHSDNHAHVKIDMGGVIDACTSLLTGFQPTRLSLYIERVFVERALKRPKQARGVCGL